MDKRLNMSNREVDRLRVIRDILDGKLKWCEAAGILGRSERQVARLCAKVRDHGNRGIVHGLRGHPSNHRLDPELLGKALSALHDPLWTGFGPTFAQQKLDTFYGIVLGNTTVRKWMTWTGLWEPHRRRAKHRSWRQRRSCVGMLVQLDGSPHDWFEGRGAWCVLLIYIDDATSRILYGEFIPVESTLHLMRTAKSYLRKWGRPAALYVDKDSIYNVNREASVDEQLRGEGPITQFTRAMSELGIQVILAGSPQAKGRVERGFDTHQDRLVKELRLRGISNILDGNRYLWGEYIPDHNRRFAVEPASLTDTHKPLLKCHDLAAILSIQEERQVYNDFTVRYKIRFFQLGPKQPVRVCRGGKVRVQERSDGSIHIVSKGQRLKMHEIPKRPPRRSIPQVVRSKELAAKAKVRRKTRCRVNPVYAAFSMTSRTAPTNPPASSLRQE